MAGLILPGEDVADIARAVALGDATVGWRGDDTMACYLGHDGTVAVYAFDARGERYLAAVVDTAVAGWRHELLARLRDGDWQRGDLFDRIDAANQKLDAERDRQLSDRKDEVAEKLAAALHRDAGHLYAGTTKRYH